jgi:hypothetical protein
MYETINRDPLEGNHINTVVDVLLLTVMMDDIWESEIEKGATAKHHLLDPLRNPTLPPQG